MANVLERFMGALGVGGAAFITAFNERQLVPAPTLDWDSYRARMFRYDYSTHYYQNTVYTKINRYAAQLKAQREIYKHIRGIYNPVQRLVEIYVSKTYGGSLDMDKLAKGAIAIAQADDTLRDAIRQIWRWSNWSTQKSIYTRHGAMKGDTAIKVVDDLAAGKVRLEVLDPAKIKEITVDEVGNIQEIIIEYYVQEEVDIRKVTDFLVAKYYTYTEIITPDSFSTFKNGEPWGYYADASGKFPVQWTNPYGFVPVVKAQHRDMGLGWGANAWNGTAGKVDELNDAASLLNDQIRKAVNVVWYYAGVNKKEDLDVSVQKKDQLPAVYGPTASQPYPMVAPIDIAAASANIQQQLAELERDMPELALYRPGSSKVITAAEIEATHGDALDRLQEARGNYNDTLCRAHMMACSIGGFRRYDNFEKFSLNSYKSGNLEHYIEDRSAVHDDLGKADKVTAMISSHVPDVGVWAELGFQQDTIDSWSRMTMQDKMITMLASQPNQPPQIPANVPDGAQQPVEGNAPAIKGAKLPADQALKVNPISPEELAAVGAMHRNMKGIA